MPRLPSPKMEWARFNLRIWREESEKFRLLSPEDRRLAAALYLHASAEGHIVDSPLAIAAAAWEDDTSRCDEIREKLPLFGFVLSDGKWSEKNALEVYYLARSRSLTNRINGAAGGRAKAVANATPNATPNATANATAIALASASPLLSSVVDEEAAVLEAEVTVPSDSSLRGEEASLSTVTKKGNLDLFGRPRIDPPANRELKVEAVAAKYLACRALVLWGDDTKHTPSKGMVREVSGRMRALIDAGFDPDFLVSLPALVDYDALDFMVRKDPLVLLRQDNAQGGKTHARRYEAALPDQTLDSRRVEILRRIGTADYILARAKGVKGAQ